jgi:CheY-like chemotaxis protein
VEDEEDVLESTRFAFESKGYQVTAAASAEEALAQITSDWPQILLIDYKLPGISGTEFIRAVREKNPTLPAILITGLATDVEEVEEECRAMGLTWFLRKPLSLDSVFQAIQAVLPPQ